MPKVSIVVRSMNDMDFIGRTMAGIAAQSFTDYEIINVDCGSTDGTYELIRGYHPAVQYQIKPADYIPGKVLNEAVKKCSGEIIVFNNSDCIPVDNHWLERLIAPFQSEKAPIATFGNQLPRPNARPLIVKDNTRAFGDGTISSQWTHFFSLATSAILKSKLEAHPFNPALQYSEDIDWSWRMKQHGFTICYVPEAQVEHSHNYSLKEVRRRFYNEGVAEADIYQSAPGWLRGFFRPWVGETWRDVKYLLKNGQVGAIGYGLVYRFWQRWSIFRGRRTRIKQLALNAPENV